MSYINYINAILDNTEIDIPNKLDLIIDGAAFASAYNYGHLLVLKELEKRNLTIVNKISGCSAGALLGSLYLINRLDIFIFYYNKIIKSIRKKNKLCIIQNIINNVSREIDLSKINNRLYITYYDTVRCKHVVVSSYKSKSEFQDILCRSTFLPFLINGEINYKNKYCDGFTPFIFKKNNYPCLFLTPLYSKKIINSLLIKNEPDIWKRVFESIDDMTYFLKGNNSKYCSYINSWKFYDFLLFRIREIITFIIIIIIEIHCRMNNILPKYIKEQKMLLTLFKIIKNFLNDILSYKVF